MQVSALLKHELQATSETPAATYTRYVISCELQATL